MFVVGVGSDLTPEYLQMLTGRDDMDRVFQVNDFEHLSDAVEEVINATACVVPEPPIERTYL